MTHRPQSHLVLSKVNTRHCSSGLLHRLWLNSPGIIILFLLPEEILLGPAFCELSKKQILGAGALKKIRLVMGSLLL